MDAALQTSSFERSRLAQGVALIWLLLVGAGMVLLSTTAPVFGCLLEERGQEVE